MEEAWPFDQPQNCAVISQRQIMQSEASILLVTHDEEDHGWQFLTGAAPKMEDVMLVLLKNVVAIDPSLYEVADMPPGWQASRIAVDSPWVRERSPPEQEGA